MLKQMPGRDEAWACGYAGSYEWCEAVVGKDRVLVTVSREVHLPWQTTFRKGPCGTPQPIVSKRDHATYEEAIRDTMTIIAQPPD